MRTHNLVLVGASLLAFVAITCAPTEPDSKQASGSASSPIPAPKPVAVTPSEPPKALQARIDAAIENVRQRDLLTTNGFWTIFHGILGLGPSVALHDPATHKPVNALDYICNGGELRGLQFVMTGDGLDVQTGPQFVGQGHQDQFVAEMAQWHIPANRRFLVQGKEYTYMDFVRHCQARARVTQNQELSWAIVVLGQYVGTDITWKNRAGEQLRFEDLVRYELEASIDDAACGGTHRLFGLTWVYQLHLRNGGSTTGVWQELADKSLKYQALAKKLQNGDGSFSTSFFRGPGNASDLQLRINTTGHILEWLALSLSDEELRQPWIQDAVNALSLMILDIQRMPMEGGTLYHAVHGLLIYYARVYDAKKLGPLKPPIPLLEPKIRS